MVHYSFTLYFHKVLLEKLIIAQLPRATQPPIQWVLGALSLAVKQLRRKADHSPPSSTEVKNA